MKNYIFLCFITLSGISCSHQDSVTFTRKTAFSEFTITLHKDNEFSHISSKDDKIPFHEKGTYTQKDSLLICTYNYEKTSYDCTTFLLGTDTFLIVEHNNQTFLYPFNKQPHGTSQVYSYTEIKASLCELHSKGLINKEIDNLYSTPTQELSSFISHDSYKSLATYCE
ncbi:MAG: hypothetical protein R6U95_05395 [Bacteroidales bacterium]